MIQVNMAYESTKRKWLFGQTSTSEHIESDVSFVAANQQKGTFFEFCLINRKVISVYSRQQCYARLGKGLKALFTNFHDRSEEHTSELQSRETISYAVFCLKKKKHK